jgi:endonuclease/exonuclease/phosphatase family metal-dependent hydrolase
MRTFRAATFNIWSRFGPWEQRLVAIREGIAALSPDVVGLQEVLRADDFDQSTLVSEGIGYHVAWGKASEQTVYPLGNAILSRWPIVRSEVVRLPDGGSAEDRSVVFAEIDAPFGRVPFFCTHLNWMLNQGHVRCLQVKALAEIVSRLAPAAGFPPVVVGDFNAEPDSDEMRFMRGLTGLGGPCVYFMDAFHVAGDGSAGSTFSKRNPFAETVREAERRIDYVLVRGSEDPARGEPIDARVCLDQPIGGVYPSDHFGVIATITTGA